MKNLLHLFWLMLLVCFCISVFGEDIDIDTRIKRIISPALISNQVNHEQIEKKLLNLLRTDSSSKDRAMVYVAIAKKYSNDIEHFSEKISQYVKKAFENQMEVIDACDMYQCLGKLANFKTLNDKRISVTERLQAQATPYIQGIAFVLNHLRIEKNVPPPPVGRFDIEPGSAQYKEAVLQHEKEMAIRHDIDQQNELLIYRDDFASQVFRFYSPMYVQTPAFARIISNAVGDGDIEKVLLYLRGVSGRAK
jgi:hypothetical protein